MSFPANASARQLLQGNLLLVGCCIFYLLWWILAFKPTGAVKGMKSGWLLIPAFLLGTAGVVLIALGVGKGKTADSFFSVRTILFAGIAAYLALLAVTWFGFHRQVTTELFLIVGWCVLAFLEINVLFGLGMLSRTWAIALFVTALLLTIMSMVCYMLYYGLSEKTGYIDGMIPLLAAGIFLSVLSVLIVRPPLD